MKNYAIKENSEQTVTKKLKIEDKIINEYSNIYHHSNKRGNNNNELTTK
jgi:hypothetical protein